MPRGARGMSPSPSEETRLQKQSTAPEKVLRKAHQPPGAVSLWICQGQVKALSEATAGEKGWGCQQAPGQTAIKDISAGPGEGMRRGSGSDAIQTLPVLFPKFWDTCKTNLVSGL